MLGSFTVRIGRLDAESCKERIHGCIGRDVKGKGNNKMTVDYKGLFDSLCECKTKHELIETLHAFGFHSDTLPTDTPNVNDLYFQLEDGTRLWFRENKIVLLTSDAISRDAYFRKYSFRPSTDGKYRTKQADIPRELEDFTYVFKFFLDNRKVSIWGETDSVWFPSKEESDPEMSKDKQFSVNTILYGPPGTGKTYNTAIYAVAICDGKSIEELTDYDAMMARFEELKAQHRVVFTTFHQSYGYEEFIEGIKPVVDPDKSDIAYTIEPGVFKKFCERAKVVPEKGMEYTGNVWYVRNRAGDIDVAPDYESRLYSEGTIKIEDVNEWKRQCNYLNDMVAGDWVVLGRGYSINAIGVITDDNPERIEDGIFHYQRRVEWKATGLEVDCRPINRGKAFSNFAIAGSWIKVQDLQKILNSDAKNDLPYVFIIDEINRGNISKIFGELITLIESTKREGKPEEASAVLPYSGEPFSVPSNVYILGTMNTADRSIALMDTALRRRFDFIEMMPDTGVLEGIQVSADGETLDVAKMLQAINTRIEYLYDREHTIGHAFFTGLRDNPSIDLLANIFQNKVVPLLQEYFYEDYEKIQLVLGDNDKSSDDFKFVLDKKVNENVIFKKSPQLDLHEKTYEIQKKAFERIRSYIEITEAR